MSYATKRVKEVKSNKPDIKSLLKETRDYEITQLKTASGEYANYLTGRIELINYIFDKIGWKK